MGQEGEHSIVPCALAPVGDTSMKPIENVRDISAITYGFIASKALFAAL